MRPALLPTVPVIPHEVLHGLRQRLRELHDAPADDPRKVAATQELEALIKRLENPSVSRHS